MPVWDLSGESRLKPEDGVNRRVRNVLRSTARKLAPLAFGIGSEPSPRRDVAERPCFISTGVAGNARQPTDGAPPSKSQMR